MKIGCTLRVGLSLQIFRYDEQVESWQILALRVWHNQAYASSLPEQTKEGGGHRDKAAGGWGRRAGVLGGPGMCAGSPRAPPPPPVTKCETRPVTTPVTPCHWSLLLFFLADIKRWMFHTFSPIWFSLYIDLSSFRQASVCLSVISVKLLTFYGKIWFQTNHISSGQILRHRLMTTFHTDPILWHQYSSSGKYVPLFRQN